MKKCEVEEIEKLKIVLRQSMVECFNCPQGEFDAQGRDRRRLRKEFL